MKYLLYLHTFHFIGPQLKCLSISSPRKLVFTFQRFCLSLCNFFFCPLLSFPFFSFVLQSFSNCVHSLFCPFVLMSSSTFVLFSFGPFVLYPSSGCTIQYALLDVPNLVWTFKCAQLGVQNIVCITQSAQFSVNNLVCKIQCAQ